MDNNIDELLQKAEKLRSEIDGNVELPRIERNFKQLAEVGKELWSRTAYNSSRDSCDIRASVLLGTQGYDLQKVSQHLESLSPTKNITILETVKDTSDVQSYLKSERENAVLSVIEEVKNCTFDTINKIYWDYRDHYWDDKKKKILNALVDSKEVSDSSDYKILNTREFEARLNLIQSNKKSDEINGDIIDIEFIINQIAVNSDRINYDEDVSVLYNMKDHHNKILEILNNLLSSIIFEKKTPGSKRERLEMFALKLAEKFCKNGHNANNDSAGVLYLLLDLMTFSDYYQNNAYNDAFDTIKRLNMLPFKNQEIKLRVNQFSRFSEEIRRNIPDILIATMNILSTQYKEARSNIPQVNSSFGLFSDSSNVDKICSEIRQKAKTLITYAGMIPYKMPGDTSAKLIQLEVLMN